MNKKVKNRLYTLLSLLICILMVAAASIRRDGKVLGYELRKDTAQTVILLTLMSVQRTSVDSLSRSWQLSFRCSSGAVVTVFVSRFLTSLFLASGVARSCRGLPS